MGKQTNTTRIAVLETIVEFLKEKVKTFVTEDRFKPVERLYYAVITAIVLTLLGAGLALVMK